MTEQIKPTYRRRGRPSEAERGLIDQRVLEAALAAFQEHGFAAAQMERIAADAGITKVSLYRRFPGKGDLLARVILTYADWIPATPAMADAVDDPIAGLRTLMWGYRQRIGDDRLVSIHRLALVTQHVEQAVRDAMTTVRARYVAPVDALVDAAKLSGRLPALPTDEIREILFGLLVNDAAALPLHGYPDVIDQAEAFAHRWAVFEHGLLMPAPQ